MVCAGLAREAGFAVIALTVDYNQRHRVELEAARAIAAQLADRHVVLPLDLRAFGGSALTGDIAVPKDGVERGHSGDLRAGAQHHLPQPRARAWPRRAARATCSSASMRSIIRAIPIAGRSSSPSSSSSPTSRPRPASRASGFTIHAPLQHMTKADIAREAQRLGLDAGLSHSCYDPLPDGAPLRAVRRLPAARQGFRRGGDRRPDGYA